MAAVLVCPTPGTEADRGPVLFREQAISHCLVPEKDIPQSICGPDMAFRGMVFGKCIDQGGQYGDVMRFGAPHDQVAHGHFNAAGCGTDFPGMP